MTDDTPEDDGAQRYRVNLEDVFEGPMDLLIHLIKKAEVDIYDIPIARITEQFIAYLEWMRQMNIDVAGDFILMASTLTHIKSKMLLPVPPSEEAEEDPRLEITRPLLEYLRIKSAAEQLAERNLLGEKTFTRKPDLEPVDDPADAQVIRLGLFELIDAFQGVLDKVSAGHHVDMARDRVSVQERINQLIDLLESSSGSLAFDEMFADDDQRDDVIVTFLAILEMAKLAIVRIVQHVPTGIIRIFYQ